MLALLLLARSTAARAQQDDLASLVEAGRYAEAMHAADRAAARAAAERDDALAAQAELARGTIWQARGFPRPAVAHFEKARDLAEAASLRLAVAAAYGALASAYGDLGQWDRVLDYAERQHEADPRPTAANEFRYRFQRGVAFAEFHDPARARATLQEALGIARTIADRRGTSMALGELASLAAEQRHDVDAALALYDEALAIAREARLPDLEATWLLDSGAALRDAERYDAARERLTAAVAVERRSGAHRVTPAAQKNLAQVLLHDGNRPAAAALLRDAQHGADAQNLGELRWQTRVERAVMARDDRQDAEAAALFEEALDLLEDAQGSVLVEQLRSGALERALSAADPYDLYAAFLLAHGETARAFFVAERGRARAFLDTLRTAGDQIARALPPEYVEAEATLLADISEGQAALRTTRRPAGERAALEAAIRTDEERLAALRLRLATDRPAVSAVRYPQLWQAEAVAAKILQPHQALVAYFLGARGSTAWIADAGGTRSVSLPAEARIDEAVRAYLKLVRASPAARAGDEAAEASRLYRLLLADLPIAPGTQQLVVVPHGILFDVPFEALRAPDGTRAIEHYEIAYAPSASSFAWLASARGAATRTPSLLAIGNPLVRGATASARDGEVAHLSLLAPLPYTHVEMRDIAAIYGTAGRVLEQGAATESALRQADLTAVAIVHFATHGLIDESSPERSALVLTAAPPADDGVLQVREVYGLRLRNALVTLSACETALGANVRGEGMIGLSRAFFYAGADVVVASLWNVNDRSTATLMTGFYEGLGRGVASAAALRQAQLAMLRGPTATRDPYFWAAFIATGNGSWSHAAVPYRGRRWTWTIVVALAVAALGLIAAARRRRTSRSRS